MKFVFICALVACFVAFLDCQKFRCDYKYYQDINMFMKYQEIPATWHEAFLRCDMEGAKLATPINAGIFRAMIKMAQKSAVSGIFTGLNTKFSAGDYFSLEGIPLSMIPHFWAKGEPNNHNNEEGCIVMLKDGYFADASCNLTMPYICYKKASTVKDINMCGTTDEGYTIDSRTGSCYKFHRFPRTYSRAFMTCAAEGGYLMIINSDTEAQVLRDIYAKNSLMSSVGSYWTDAAYIGVYDWDLGGEWKTIFGDTLTTAGYNSFNPGEPNNASGSQFCGAGYRNGNFDDMWCDRRAQFICEKDPKSLANCLNDTPEKYLLDLTTSIVV